MDFVEEFEEAPKISITNSYCKFYTNNVIIITIIISEWATMTEIQIICMLGSVQILRKVLSVIITEESCQTARKIFRFILFKSRRQVL